MLKNILLFGVMVTMSTSADAMNVKFKAAGLTLGVPLSILAAGIKGETCNQDELPSEQEQDRIKSDHEVVTRFVDARCTHILEREPLEAQDIHVHEQCQKVAEMISRVAAAAHDGDRRARKELQNIADEARRIEAEASSYSDE